MEEIRRQKDIEIIMMRMGVYDAVSYIGAVHEDMRYGNETLREDVIYGIRAKDKSEKYLENYPDVFADLANVLVFGKELVEPEDLEAGPTDTVYKSATGDFCENLRDILKYVQKFGICLAMIGIENQSTIDKDMVIRVMGYDYTSYKIQVDAGKMRCPVITTVLYFGDKPWNGATTLKELLVVANEERFGMDDGNVDRQIMLEYIDWISDYKINVVDVPRLPAETIEKFTSDFRVIADFFAHKKDSDYAPSERKLKHPQAVLNMLREFTGDGRYTEIKEEMLKKVEKGESVSMCEFAERMEQKGISQGISQGRREGEMLSLVKLVIKKLSKGKTLDVIAEELEEEYELVQLICNIANKMAPDYNVEAVFEAYKHRNE